MRLNLLILAVLAGAIALASWAMRAAPPGGAAPGAPEAVSAGTVLPAFSFRTADGRTVASETLRGRPAVLNFWATWCLPCFAEMPRLLAAAEEEDITLVLMAVDDDDRALPRFFAKLDPESRRRLALRNVIVARDPDKAVSQDVFQTVRLPETILIDRDLIMRDKIAGAEWSMEDLRRALRSVK